MVHRTREIHIVKNLELASWCSEGPFGKSTTRLKGSFAKGKTFERSVARALARKLEPEALIYNRWIRFRDAGEWHYAQVDLVVVAQTRLWLLEVKRTQTTDAWVQLGKLYKPLLEMLYPGLDIICVQVCKNLLWAPHAEISALREAVDPNVFYTYHWVGEDFRI
jgi:hypothetical protein